jgi:hypothetical protein
LNEDNKPIAKRPNAGHRHRLVLVPTEPVPLADSMTISGGSHHRVKYWEIIADNLSKAGWSWGCVSAVDSNGGTIWIVDAHRGDGKRFVVHAKEKLGAFLELESAIRSTASGETRTSA